MATEKKRVVSGMRTTGKLHLGHFHGVLTNWLDFQQQYDCFFFAADWHALTSEFQHPEIVSESIQDLFLDWLSVGIDPEKVTLFIQSKIKEHAELHLLLSMITPLSWLLRNPTFKDSQGDADNKTTTWQPTAFWATRCCRQPTSSSTVRTWCPSASTSCRTWS